MELSILICTLPARANMFHSLLETIHSQIQGTGPKAFQEIEIISDRNRFNTVGYKRDQLLRQSTGNFIVYIDDDDRILDGYIHDIYHGIKNNPDVDCIGISGYMTTNGQDRRDWHISREYGSWFEQDKVYYRTPNHISPVKGAIAKQVGFKDQNFSEDYEYSMGILPMLHKEFKINRQLYHYNYNSK